MEDRVDVKPRFTTGKSSYGFLFWEERVMKATRSFRTVLLFSLLFATCAAAQPAGRSGGPMRRGLFGDWDVKMEFGEGRQMNAILSFSRDGEGNLTAQWISLWGVNDLKEVKFEEGKLSFVQVVQFGDNEFTSNFTGTIEEGKLTGTLTSDRGESKVQGQPRPRIPRAAGTWEMKFKIGDRDVTTKLVIGTDKENNLAGQWESQWGEHTITDLEYGRRTLAFKRKSKFQDQEMDSTFEGTIQGDTLTGTMKSQMGDIPVEGTRLGADLIGMWNLEISAEWGQIKQRLLVNPDLSGLYGSLPVKKINFEDGKVNFTLVMEFGDQPFEMNFAGKINDGKLTGEMVTSRGTQKITGTKVVRPVRRRPGT